MKNNYSSIQNINKTGATIKKFFIAIILIASAFFNNTFGQVNITAPNPPPITTCSFPSAYFPLGNIVITEVNGGDISAFGTLILSAPTNFEFQPSFGNVTFTSARNISTSSIVVTSATITITISGTGTTLIDAITISGIELRAINFPSGPSSVTRTGGGAIIAGDVFGAIHATCSSILNTVTGGTIAGAQTICSGGDPISFTETAASTGSGTLTYQWKNSADGYSAVLATTQTYNVPAGLTATTTYRRITKSNYGGLLCAANSNDLIVTVNSITGGSVTSPQSICVGGNPAVFTETAGSTGSGVFTYEWKSSTDGYSATLSTSTTYDVPSGLTTTTTYRRVTTSTLGGVGCTANSNDIIITVISVNGGTISSPQTICSGSSPSQLTGTAPSGGDNINYTYEWQQSTTSPTTGFTAATNTITLSDYYPNTLSTTTWYRRKVASAGCSSSDTAAIKMNVEVPVVTNSSTFTTCSGAPMNIALTSNVPSSFSWTIGTITGSISGATGSTGSNILQTLTNLSNSTAGTIQYIITPTSTSGSCAGSAFTITVTVNPAPTISNSNSVSICSGTSVNIALNASLPSTFSWTIGTITGGVTGASAGGGPSLNQFLNNPNPSPGTVPYIVTPTSISGGCVGSTYTITAIVNPIPLANAGTDVSVCLGDATTLTASGGTSYTWYNGGSTITAAISLTVNPSTTTAYRVNVTNSYSCSKFDTVIVTVIPIPAITATTPASRCGTGTVNLGATVSDGIIHWWDAETGGTDLGTGTTFTTTSISDTTTYYVNATNGCVPATRTPVIATVNSIPLLTTTVTSSSICIGNNATLTASGTGITTYLWSPGGEITASITDNPSTTSTYTVTGTDANSCSDTATITITVNPLPAMTNINAATICSGATINIPLTSDVTSTYSWIASDNLNTNGESLTTESTATLSNVIFTTLGPQNVVYSVIPISTGGSCTGLTQTITVMVNPLPIVNAGADTTICLGQSTTLMASGGSAYLWSTGSSANSISIAPAATDTYGVTGTLNGCSNTDSVLVTVNSIPTVNGGSDTTICAGQSTTLTASGGSAYIWSTGSSANSITVAPTATDTYGVTGTLNGCSNTDSVLVTVNSTPTVNGGSDTTICAGQSTTLTASGGSAYIWSTGSSANSISIAPTGTYTYGVTGTLNGCSNTDSVLVTVNPAPLANIATGTPICHGDTATLTGTGGVSFSWSNGLTSSTITVNPDSSTSYTLTVTDTLGCTASVTAMVSVTPSKDISGHVSYSGGDVITGTAVLYKYEQSQTRFDSIQVKPLDSSGNYLFDSINQGQYLVKVFADSASYPSLINTYYGDEFLWDGDSVHVINHSCDLNTTLDSVTMVELTGTGGGIGLIIGQIIEGISFGRVEGEPIPGIDVKLGKNPGGSIVATTNTDSTGHFTFSGVANGNYTIYVDIPGLGRDSTYTFDIDSTNNQFLNQNYIADSTSVFPNTTSTVGISNPATVFENKFSVYPNPVKGNTTIEYSILQMTDSKTTLEVYSVLGVKINTLVNTIQQAGTYKYNFNPQNYQLNSGVYFITLTIDGKTTTKRIVVME